MMIAVAVVVIVLLGSIGLYRQMVPIGTEFYPFWEKVSGTDST